MEIKKKVFNFGTSAGIIIEKGIMRTMGLKEGDEVIVDIRKASDRFDRNKEIKNLISKTDEFMEGLKQREELKIQLKEECIVEIMKEVEDRVFEKLKDKVEVK